MEKLTNTVRIFETLFLMLFAYCPNAQSILVDPNLDGLDEFPFTRLVAFIEQDTTEDGERKHDTYLLQNGGEYFFECEVEWDFDVHFKSVGDKEDGKPLIIRNNIVKESSSLRFYEGSGNLSFAGIHLVLGDKGPFASSYEKRPFQFFGNGKSYRFSDCIVEKAGMAIATIRGDQNKITFTNCQLRNVGDFQQFPDAGSIIDMSDHSTDSLIFQNNVIYNLVDRIMRSTDMKGLNYFEFDHNTIFNHLGRHGLIQLNNTEHTVITNNVFADPVILGSNPMFSYDQVEPLDSIIFVFSLDTLVESALVEMANNNVFWSDKVSQYFEVTPKIGKPLMLSPLLEDVLSDVSNAIFEEVLQFQNVPEVDPIIAYANEIISDPTSMNMTDMMIEPINFMDTDYDKGYLFDFSEFSPCYSSNTFSSTAADDGLEIGVRGYCSLNSSIGFITEESDSNLLIYPNPSNGKIFLKFYNPQAGEIEINLYSISGLKVASISNKREPRGFHEIGWKPSEEVRSGTYIVELLTERGRETQIIFISK